MYYITVIRASQFTLNRIFWSKTKSYYSTLYTRTPSSQKPPQLRYQLLQKGSKPNYYALSYDQYYSFPKKKSILSLSSDFQTCLLIISTDYFTILKTLRVPSIPRTLLPIAIMIVPRKIQVFSSIQGLYIVGKLKSIFQNQSDSLEVDLLQASIMSQLSFVSLLYSYLIEGFAVQKWQCGHKSCCLLVSLSYFYNYSILFDIYFIFITSLSLLSFYHFLYFLIGFFFKNSQGKFDFLKLVLIYV